MQQMTQFENIIKCVLTQIGNGNCFFCKLSEHELALLDDLTQTNMNDSDLCVIDSVTRQQRACAIYYESICAVIDVYDDRKRQQSLINNLISAPIQKCKQILSNNQLFSSQSSVFFEFCSSLHIFCGIIHGLRSTETATHPLNDHIECILNICSDAIAIDASAAEQKLESLYNVICNVMEAILDIFGSKTKEIIDGLVRIALKILKCIKSECS